MPTPLARFNADPTPTNAIDLAIEVHTRFCLRAGVPFNVEYVHVLTHVKGMIAENAARNRATGGK